MNQNTNTARNAVAPAATEPKENNPADDAGHDAVISEPTPATKEVVFGGTQPVGQRSYDPAFIAALVEEIESLKALKSENSATIASLTTTIESHVNELNAREAQLTGKAAPRIRCKFHVASVERASEDTYAAVLRPVVSGSPENDGFFKLTPGGQLNLGPITAEVAKALAQHHEFYLDFTPAN